MLVTLASAVLFTFSALELPAFPAKLRPQELTSASAKSLLLVSAAIVLGAFAVGDLTYMGTAVSATGNITPLGAISAVLGPALVPLTVLCLSQESSRRWRAIFLVLLFIFALALIPLGRRVLLYSIVSALFALLSLGKRPAIRSSRKLLWIGVPVVLAFISAGFYLFFSLRLAINVLGPSYSLSEALTYALSLLRSDTRDLATQFAANIASRPFILSYLAGLYAAETTHSPLGGQEVTYATQTAIPSAIFHKKAALLPASPEQFVHSALGIPVFDGPNTILTAGLNDFGVIGALLYPLALVAVYATVRRLVAGRLPSILYYLVVFRLLYQLLYVEQSLSGMLTVGLRDLALITLVFLVLRTLFRLRLYRSAPPQSIGNVGPTFH